MATQRNSSQGRSDLSNRRRPAARFLAVQTLAFLAAFGATLEANAALTLKAVTAYNLVVDSNATTPASYAPKAATLGAKVCNTDAVGTAPRTNIVVKIGNTDTATDAADGVTNSPGYYAVKDSDTAAFESANGITDGRTQDVGFATGGAFNAWGQNTGNYSLIHQSGSVDKALDATRTIASLAPGKCRTEYWVLSYPHTTADATNSAYTGSEKALWGDSVKPTDDLTLDYDLWVSDDNADVEAPITKTLTLRNEISAMANKIEPNSDGKVPPEYLAAIGKELGWDSTTPSGTPEVYPGEVAVIQGVWYDFGNVGAGFDNDGDLVPDYNAWMQPVGDASSFDPGCARLVKTYGVVIVKDGSATKQILAFVDELYFDNISPDNTGAVGLVFYEYAALDGECTVSLSPYQEVASGFDNEKFNADFGVGPSITTADPTNAFSLDKNVGVDVVNGFLDFDDDNVTAGDTGDDGGRFAGYNIENGYLDINGNTTPAEDPGDNLASIGRQQLPVKGGLVYTDTSYTTTYNGVLTTNLIQAKPALAQNVVYTVDFSNVGNRAVGQPDYNLPVVITDKIPSNTQYGGGAGSALNVYPFYKIKDGYFDVTGEGTIDASDTDLTGKYTAGYKIRSGRLDVDDDGNATVPDANDDLDKSIIGYRIIDGLADVDNNNWISVDDDITPAYTIRYSTNSGVTWTATEPSSGTASPVWIQWWMNTPLSKGSDAAVSYRLIIPSGYAGALVNNVAGLGLGNNDPFLEDDAMVLLSGPRAIKGVVFHDNGGTGGTKADGVYYDAATDANSEPAISTIKLSLYWDNSTQGTVGELDQYDVLVSTQDSSTVTYGTPNYNYNFTGIPNNTNWIVVVDKFDTGLNTTSAPTNGPGKGYAPTTRTEIPVSVVTTDVTGIDFGFFVPLDVTKRIIGAGTTWTDSDADTKVEIGDGKTFTYEIGVANLLPSSGTPKGQQCEYTVWASKRDDDYAPAQAAENHDAALGASGPDGIYSELDWSTANSDRFWVTTFNIPQKPGNIVQIAAVWDYYLSTGVVNEAADLEVWTTADAVLVHYDFTSGQVNAGSGTDRVGSSNQGISKPIIIPAQVASGGATVQVRSGFLDIDNDGSTTSDGDDDGWFNGYQVINGYLDLDGDGTTGEAPDDSSATYGITVGVGAYAVIGGLIDWAGGGTILGTDTGAAVEKVWNWTVFKDYAIYMDETKTSGTQPVNMQVDGFAFKITTDEACETSANQDTTFGPVPLVDNYDEVKLTYISSSPPADCVNTTGCVGEVKWNDVGPIPAGTTKIVSLTMLVNEQATDPQDVVNTATVTGDCEDDLDTDGDGADYLNGKCTNTDSASVTFETKDLGSISGRVWWDDNQDNAYSGETPFVGVRVYLCEGLNNNPCTTALGSYRQTVYTDSNGQYTFNGLTLNDAIDYVVTVETLDFPFTPEWKEDTDNLSNDGNDYVDSNATDVGTVADRANINFMYDTTAGGAAAISGYVWDDKDADGNTTKEGEDDPLNGWTVTLYSDATCATSLTSTTTDANGHYIFKDLTAAPTTYCVKVTPAANWQQTLDQDDTDHPCTPYNNSAGCDNQDQSIVLSTNTTSTGHDFSYTKTGAYDIGDTVFYDLNGNGKYDAGETGIPNITVWLYVDQDADGEIDSLDDVVIKTDVTDNDGKYLFENYPVGNYIVKVNTADTDFGDVSPSVDPDEDGYVCLICDGLGLVKVSAADVLDIDFGYTSNGGEIGDTIFWDANNNGTQDRGEGGIANVRVNLYTFDDADSDSIYDYGETINALAFTTYTNSSGYYLFGGLLDNVAGKGYLVDVDETTLPNYVAGTPSTPMLTADPGGDGAVCSGIVTTDIKCDGKEGTIIVNGNSYMGADFGFDPPGVIGDTLWIDTNNNGERDIDEKGIAYVTVTLYIDDGDGIWEEGQDTTVYGTPTSTDVNGNYIFYNVPNSATVTTPYWVRVDYTDTDFPANLAESYDKDNGTQLTPVTPKVDGVTGALIESGSVTKVFNSLTGTSTACSAPGCTDLSFDFGYRYYGTTTLSGTVCLELDNTNQGYCGTDNTGTDYGTGVDTNEVAYGSSLAGSPPANNREPTQVFLYYWNDGAAGDGVVAVSELTLYANTWTTSTGDYTFSNLPDLGGDATKGYVVSVSAPEPGLEMRTTQATATATWIPSTTVVGKTYTDGLSTYSAGGYQGLLNWANGATKNGFDFAFAYKYVMDFGDLPASYSTRYSAEGARHLTPAGGVSIWFGTGDEPTDDPNGDDDGQPTTAADGDDGDGNDDEDGVTFDTSTWKIGSIAAGRGGSVTVNVQGTVATTAWVGGWVDFNRDGDFQDSGETVINMVPVSVSATAKDYTFYFDIPTYSAGSPAYQPNLTSSTSPPLYSRFRLFYEAPSPESNIGKTGYRGPSTDGEVEDHSPSFVLDYGDAPSSYDTTYATSAPTSSTYGDGARHYVGASNPYMGSPPDSAESDGLAVVPGADNNGTNGDGADEDGLISFNMGKGTPADPTYEMAWAWVAVHNPSTKPVQLVGWADFTKDGTFKDQTYERSGPDLLWVWDYGPDGVKDADVNGYPTDDDKEYATDTSFCRKKTAPACGGFTLANFETDNAATGFDVNDGSFSTGNIPPNFDGEVAIRWTSIVQTELNAGAGAGASFTSYVRLRLTSDGFDTDATKRKYFFSDNSPTPGGVASNGEIEDYQQTFNPTYVNVSKFQATNEAGSVVVNWETGGEVGTLGFHLERYDQQVRGFVRVNATLLPALISSTEGGAYRLPDPGAKTGGALQYRLIEVEDTGKENILGPWTVQVSAVSGPRMTTGFVGIPRSPDKETSGRYGQSKKEQTLFKTRGLKAKEPSREGTGSVPLKIAVHGSGVHLVTNELISQAFGITVDEVKQQLTANAFALSNKGVQVPTFTVAEGLLFYGEAIDSLYTRDNVYLLSRGKGLLMQTLAGGATSTGDPVAVSFDDTVIFGEKLVPFTHYEGDPDGDYWYHGELLAYSAPTTADYTITLPNLINDGRANYVAVRMMGGSDNRGVVDHSVEVYVNGKKVGAAKWDGEVPITLEASVPSGLLVAGANTVTVKLLKPTGAYSLAYVKDVEIRYARGYQAVSNKLEFEPNEPGVVQVSGFSTDQVVALEISDPKAPRIVGGMNVRQGRSGWVAAFRQNGGSFTAAGRAGWSTVTSGDLTWGVNEGLKRAKNRDEHLVIGPASLREGAMQLVNYRKATGYTSRFVSLEGIYDEFNWGIPDGHAVRDFLRYAQSSWKVAPSYAALVGKGSIDGADRLGKGGNLFPVLLASTPWSLAASDVRFGDVSGEDGVMEVMIGRIPVLTNAEMTAYVAKLQQYEGATRAAWAEDMYLVADQSDSAGNFTLGSRSLLARASREIGIEEAFVDEEGAASVRSQILGAFGSGALMVNYLGHGGPAVIGRTPLLMDSDVATMGNVGRYPFFNAMTCTTGRFEYPGSVSLAERLVVPGDRGAIAALAPSGLSINADAVRVNQAFFDALFNSENRIVGDALKFAQNAYAGPSGQRFMLETYVLFGDPATRLLGANWYR